MHACAVGHTGSRHGLTDTAAVRYDGRAPYGVSKTTNTAGPSHRGKGRDVGLGAVWGVLHLLVPAVRSSSNSTDYLFGAGWLTGESAGGCCWYCRWVDPGFSTLESELVPSYDVGRRPG